MSLTRTSICMGEAKETLELMGEDWVRESQNDTQWDAGLGCRSGEQSWENDSLGDVSVFFPHLFPSNFCPFLSRQLPSPLSHNGVDTSPHCSRKG